MDDVTIQGSADTGYGTSYKDNVVITNTGNTKAFIRAAIVGQWLDYLDRPVFGFTDKVNQLYLVESWYEDQFVNKGRDQGLFVGLPGYIGNGDNPLRDWTLCEDGYYYYTLVVPPLSDVEDPALATPRPCSHPIRSARFRTLRLPVRTSITRRCISGWRLPPRPFRLSRLTARKGACIPGKRLGRTLPEPHL